MRQNGHSDPRFKSPYSCTVRVIRRDPPTPINLSVRAGTSPLIPVLALNQVPRMAHRVCHVYNACRNAQEVADTGANTRFWVQTCPCVRKYSLPRASRCIIAGKLNLHTTTWSWDAGDLSTRTSISEEAVTLIIHKSEQCEISYGKC